jgi:hypothetical protein
MQATQTENFPAGAAEESQVLKTFQGSSKILKDFLQTSSSLFVHCSAAAIAQVTTCLWKA